MLDQAHISTLVKKVMKKISNLNLVILIVIISKHKNIFAKGYTPNWPEEIFVIKTVKKAALWKLVINDLNGEETVVNFFEKNCKNQIKQHLELKK